MGTAGRRGAALAGTGLRCASAALGRGAGVAIALHAKKGFQAAASARSNFRYEQPTFMLVAPRAID
jgi:hypothetical protein